MSNYLFICLSLSFFMFLLYGSLYIYVSLTISSYVSLSTCCNSLSVLSSPKDKFCFVLFQWTNELLCRQLESLTIPMHTVLSCVYVWMCMCMYVCMYVCMYACMYVFMHVFMCLFVCMYLCMYLCMYVRRTYCMHVLNVGIHARFIQQPLFSMHLFPDAVWIHATVGPHHGPLSSSNLSTGLFGSHFKATSMRLRLSESPDGLNAYVTWVCVLTVMNSAD